MTTRLGVFYDAGCFSSAKPAVCLHLWTQGWVKKKKEVRKKSKLAEKGNSDAHAAIAEKKEYFAQGTRAVPRAARKQSLESRARNGA